MVSQHKPWTWVSTMFVLVRYLGLSWAILLALAGSTFVPGPVKICTAIYLVADWVFPIFLGAADFVMILRVYAMWNQSTRILYILLFIYVPQVIVSFIYEGFYSNRNTYPVTVTQVIDLSVCSGSSFNASSPLLLTMTALRFALSVMLLILAVIPTLKDSLVLYKATGKWQLNHYMKVLVKDGIFYFLVYIIYNISEAWLEDDSAFSQLVLALLNYTTLCPLMPRFIVSVRELYDRDLSDRWQGLDTGFGVTSQPAFRENATMSAIEFVDVAPELEQGQVAEGEVDDSEAIRLEMLGDGTLQV